MKMFFKIIFIAISCARVWQAEVFAESKSIYGPDDRVDYYAVSAEMQGLSDSVVSLWSAGRVEELPGGDTMSLMTKNYGETLGLCPGEKFRDQPIGAFGSGSLVADDVVMTAGHCVKNETECRNMKIVFGYAIKTAGGTAVTTLPAQEVYGCKKIIQRLQRGEPGFPVPSGDSHGADWALIQLDRKVTGHKPLPVSLEQPLKKGDKVFVIGYPTGLPLKVADNASITNVSMKESFLSDLDTFGVNSGSPVFNAATGQIIGVLSGGAVDFKDTPNGCREVAAYEQGAGQEYVTKLSVMDTLLRELGAGLNVSQKESRPVNFLPSQMSPAEFGTAYDLNF